MVHLEASIHGTEPGGGSIFSPRTRKSTRKSLGSSVKSIITVATKNRRKSTPARLLIEGITKKKEKREKKEKKEKKSRRSSIESKVRKLFGRKGKYQSLTQAPTNDSGADSVDQEESTTCEPVSITDETCYSLSTILGTMVDYSANDSDISVLGKSVGGVSSHDDIMGKISVVQGFLGDDEDTEASEQFLKPAIVSDLPLTHKAQPTSGELSVEYYDADGCNGKVGGDYVAGNGFEESFMEIFEVDVDNSTIEIGQVGVPLSVDIPSPAYEFHASGCESVETPDSSCNSRSLLVGTSPSPLSDQPAVAVVVATAQEVVQTPVDRSNDVFEESEHLFDPHNASAAEVSFEAEIMEELPVLTSNQLAQTVAHSADDLLTPVSELQIYFKSAIILDEIPAWAATNPTEPAIKQVKRYRLGRTTVCILVLIGMCIALFVVETWGSIHDRVQHDFYSKMQSFELHSKNQIVDSSLAPLSSHALARSNDFSPVKFSEPINMSTKKQVEDMKPPAKSGEAKTPYEKLSNEDVVLMLI
jgi:hypothetical protein